MLQRISNRAYCQDGCKGTRISLSVLYGMPQKSICKFSRKSSDIGTIEELFEEGLAVLGESFFFKKRKGLLSRQTSIASDGDFPAYLGLGCLASQAEHESDEPTEDGRAHERQGEPAADVGRAVASHGDIIATEPSCKVEPFMEVIIALERRVRRSMWKTKSFA